MSDAPKPTIKFKSIKKKRAIRQRRDDDDDDKQDEGNLPEGEKDSAEVLRETIELQKLRSRSHGISAVTLASGVKMTKVDEMITKDQDDPFKIKTGGLLDLSKAKGTLTLGKRLVLLYSMTLCYYSSRPCRRR